jgi:hypothetical protein
MVMTRFHLIILLLFADLFYANAQEGWQVEIMPGVAVYRGDLSQGPFSLKSVGPGVNLNVKYDFGDMVVLRGGIGWGMIRGDDKESKKDYIRGRNLSFKSMIAEMSLSAEINLLDPEAYYAYPYLLTGFGIFRFNPYAYDKNNNKVNLQPLGTEGQGLPQYPGRHKYSLTQPFIPFGGGWKYNVKGKYAVSFEMAVRYLFTDYLDDVSTTYINPGILLNERGQTAVDMAFRQTPRPLEGEQRGNEKTKDFYIMSGVKFTWYMNRKKTP